jgi:PDZ domain-containing secreted protein
MMDWQKTSLWLLIVGVIFCGWCNLLSGIGGWLMGYDLGQREARAALLPESGVLVTRVERGGPADEAGIRRGDTIIAIDGVTIPDVTVLHNQLLNYSPGEEIEVTYRHNLSERITQVILEERPDDTTDLPYLGIYYTARAAPPADI